MILRRIADAIRSQNWFTVLLEILIVVLGVVIGIEVSNWNDVRKFDAQERDYLVQLREEMLINQDQIEHRLIYVGQIVTAGNRTLAFLSEDRPCADDCIQLLIDFFQASQAWGTGYYTSVYYEMQRLGLPRSTSVKQAADNYYRTFDGLGVTLDLLPDYRKQVRAVVPASDIALLWRHCHTLTDDDIEILEQNCAAKLGAVNAAPVIEAIRTLPGLYNNLNGWIGQNIFAQRAYATQLAKGTVTVAAIDAELEHTK